jgi:hypothetical protein
MSRDDLAEFEAFDRDRVPLLQTLEQQSFWSGDELLESNNLGRHCFSVCTTRVCVGDDCVDTRERFVEGVAMLEDRQERESWLSVQRRCLVELDLEPAAGSAKLPKKVDIRRPVAEEVVELALLHHIAHVVLDVEVNVSDLQGAGCVRAEHVDRAHVIDVETPVRYARQQFD